MIAFAVATVLTCWLCALLAIPRGPIPGHEVQELVYRRLIGRYHLLLACAIVTTVVVALAILLRAMVVALPEASS